MIHYDSNTSWGDAKFEEDYETEVDENGIKYSVQYSTVSMETVERFVPYEK